MNWSSSPSAQPEVSLAIEAEQGLLGAALHFPAAIDKVRDILTPDDFADPVHRRFYEMMCAKRDEGGGFDAASLRRMLADQDLGGGLTAGQYLSRLSAEASTVSNARDYAVEIRKYANLRRVRMVSEDLSAGLTLPTSEPGVLAVGAIESLDAILANTSSLARPCVPIGVAATRAVTAVKDVRRGAARLSTTYGISRLDNMTLGMKPGELIIAAGRPGMGKSTFGVSVALQAALANSGVYFVSLEMEAQQLAERALASLLFQHGGSVLSYHRIAEAMVPQADLLRLEQAQVQLQATPLMIEEQAGLTVSQIGARARRQQARMARNGIRLGVIVVDHLGLVRASKRYEGNRVQEITEITAGLKVLAKDLGVAVMALCQLSREAERRDDKRPQLSDLRDSGSIEQDADTVLGLYREAYYLDRKPHRTPDEDDRLLAAQQVLELEVLKNRHGPPGRLKLFCSVPCNVIAENS